ncbi:MAG: sulfotransferase domain-containing protein [Bryobacteraceae bacterium]
MGHAVVSAKAAEVRLFHLTFYKCGSQWVRDILSDSRIAEYSKYTLAASGIDLQCSPWPKLQPGQIASPIYSTGAGEWRLTATAGDRAYVVIRDPRDIVVSLVFSVSLSHAPSGITLLLRGPIADAAPAHRLQIGMFLLAQWAEHLRTWKDAGEFSNVLLARYESLIGGLPGELRRLLNFLNWDVPDEVVDAVAAENAFEKRSGRKPGDENEFSHRRKGIAGDWRNHFDRDLGRLFEDAFPCLLTELGYEERTDWWRALPESIAAPVDNPERQRSRLLAVLKEHETELAAVRLAAEERLRDVHILHAALHDATSESDDRLRNVELLHAELTEQTHASGERQRTLATLSGEVKELLQRHESPQARIALIRNIHRQLASLMEKQRITQQAAEARLERVTTQIGSLQRQLRIAQQAADERLADIVARESALQELESSFAWRLGFRPVRALFSLVRK